MTEKLAPTYFAGNPFAEPIEEIPFLQVMRLHPEAQIPARKHVGDAGFDLFCLRETTIQPQGFMDISTGVAIKLPDGYWARITGRSSTWRTWHLQVVEGIIDNGYTGEFFIGVFNPTQEAVCIPTGTRLAQFTLHRLETAGVLIVDKLPETDRGSSGFGSTGV